MSIPGCFLLMEVWKTQECSTVALHTDTDIRRLNFSIGGPLTLMKSQHDLPHRFLRPDGMDLSNALFFYHRLKVVTPQSIAKPHCPLPGNTTNAPMIGPYAVACNHMCAFMESIGYDIPSVTWLCAQYGHSYWIALLAHECSDIHLHKQFPLLLQHFWMLGWCESGLTVYHHFKHHPMFTAFETHIFPHTACIHPWISVCWQSLAPKNWVIAHWSCLCAIISQCFVCFNASSFQDLWD